MAKTTEPKASEGGATPAAETSPAKPEPAKPAPQTVTPAQAKTLAERAETGEKLSVGELALVTGNLRRVNLPVITTVNRDRSSAAYGRSEIDAQPTAYTAAHQAAATLHGWPRHSHHANRQMQLTLADYRKALAAASTTPDGYLTSVPHAPAFSPYALPVTLVTTALVRVQFDPTKG